MEASSSQAEIDPRQDALEEVAFTAWQFAAAWQKVSFHPDMKPVKQPDDDEWRRAANLIHAYGLTAAEVENQARSYYRDTVEVLHPTDNVEFFQKELAIAKRGSQYFKALRFIKGAVRKRMLLEADA